MIVTINVNFLHSLSVKGISIHQELITFHFQFFYFSRGQHRAVEVYDNQRIVHGWINLILLLHQCSILKSALEYLAWLVKVLCWISGITDFKYNMGGARNCFYLSLIWHGNWMKEVSFQKETNKLIKLLSNLCHVSGEIKINFLFINGRVS